MPRTDKQIAEFMEYYSTAPKDERAWALDHLARQENKSIDEIQSICADYHHINLRKGAQMPEELTDSIKNKVRSGMSNEDIVNNYGISTTTLTRIKKRMSDAGEDFPKQPKGRRKKEPESEPEKVKTSGTWEEAVEKKKPYKKPEIIQAPKLPARDCRKLWQELAEQLADFAVGTFGAGTDVTSMYWNENPAQADVEFRTADGKRISIHMEKFA